MDKHPLSMHSHRVLFGLSRIGYTPTSAICDIVDNAVTAQATKIYIRIIKEEEGFLDSRANNVKEYLVIDNGSGMTLDGILNALSLGSNDSSYSDDSLSKFGLGLKSAAFAQGNRLEIISGTGSGIFNKFIVDLDLIKDEYFCVMDELSDDDQALIDQFLPDQKGTIIRITRIHKSNHPSISKTTHDLEKRLGIIYFYFLQDGLTIDLSGKLIEPYDVLFVDEALQNGDLNENVWEGRTVQWLLHPQEYTIDGDNAVTCMIEATQLPYPPIFQLDNINKKTIRDKYNISGRNYGFYVYRNKRLISWAERFEGESNPIIPIDKDYYAFRGRILINTDADNCFNIDVKKSNISLSDEASRVIDDVAYQLKHKSKSAWKKARGIHQSFTKDNPHRTVNNIVSALDDLDDLPGDLPTPEEEIEQQKRTQQVVEDIKNKMVEETKKRIKQETGVDVKGPISEEEIDKTVKGSDENADKVFHVDTLEDNLLWEPYFDATKKQCIRINKNHRFARLIYDENIENADMQVVFDLILYNLVEADIYIQTKMKKYERTTVEAIMTEYRRVTSEFLAALCRNKDIDLPPNSGGDQ